MVIENVTNPEWGFSPGWIPIQEVKRTKKGHIHRGEEVTIPPLKTKIINACYEDSELIGYRISLNGWWFTLPVEVVEAYVRDY